MNPDDLSHLRRARDLLDREYARALDVPTMSRAALMSPALLALDDVDGTLVEAAKPRPDARTEVVHAGEAAPPSSSPAA